MYLCCFFWYVNFFARKSDRVSFLTNLKSGWGLYKLFFTPKSDFWYPKTYSTTLDTFGILKHSTSLWTNHWHLELEFLTTRWNLIKPCHPDSKTFQFGKKNALFWSRLWKCDGSFMPLFANQPLKSQWHMLLRVDLFHKLENLFEFPAVYQKVILRSNPSICFVNPRKFQATLHWYLHTKLNP